jgi:hypothetical protein
MWADWCQPFLWGCVWTDDTAETPTVTQFAAPDATMWIPADPTKVASWNGPNGQGFNSGQLYAVWDDFIIYWPDNTQSEDAGGTDITCC